MSQPLQAESPVLVRSIEDDGVELVGRFHYVALVRNRPRTLGTWRVTTESQGIADRIAQLLGGHVHEDSTGNLVQILTTSSTIEILLMGPNALYIGWQHDERSTCDGVTQGGHHGCVCPTDLELRRVAAKQGRGCRPRAEIQFRLQDDQTVGLLNFVSDDWSFVEQVITTQRVLNDWAGLGFLRAQLGLHRSLHTLRSGMVLPYTRPVITIPGRHCSSSPVSMVAGISVDTTTRTCSRRQPQT